MWRRLRMFNVGYRGALLAVVAIVAIISISIIGSLGKASQAEAAAREQAAADVKFWKDQGQWNEGVNWRKTNLVTFAKDQFKSAVKNGLCNKDYNAAYEDAYLGYVLKLRDRDMPQWADIDEREERASRQAGEYFSRELKAVAGTENDRRDFQKWPRTSAPTTTGKKLNSI